VQKYNEYVVKGYSFISNLEIIAKICTTMNRQNRIMMAPITQLLVVLLIYQTLYIFRNKPYDEINSNR